MPPKSRPETSWRQSWLLKGAVLLACVVLFLGGVIWAGRWGLEHLRGSDRYVIPFNEIDCEPPVGMERQKFLDQVRYYASPRLPELGIEHSCYKWRHFARARRLAPGHAGVLGRPAGPNSPSSSVSVGLRGALAAA